MTLPGGAAYGYPISTVVSTGCGTNPCPKAIIDCVVGYTPLGSANLECLSDSGCGYCLINDGIQVALGGSLLAALIDCSLSCLAGPVVGFAWNTLNCIINIGR